MFFLLIVFELSVCLETISLNNYDQFPYIAYFRVSTGSRLKKLRLYWFQCRRNICMDNICMECYLPINLQRLSQTVQHDQFEDFQSNLRKNCLWKKAGVVGV